MITQNPVYSSAHLEVSESEPREHVPHGDGRWSVEVAGHPAILYLVGTPTELADWADKVRAVATALLGEAVTV